MAVFKAVSNNDFDSYDALSGGTIATRLAATFRYVSAQGFQIKLTGTGFTYDGSGIPIGGTVTGLDAFDGSVQLLHYTRLSLALTAYSTLALGRTSGVLGVATPDIDALFALARAGNDMIIGNDAAKTISGYAGNDTIYANGGDDWMNGGTGVDRFFGGAGKDGVFFDDVGVGGHGVRVNMALGRGNILDDGYGHVETASNVEKYAGSKFNDRLAGGLHGDSLWGEDGDDSLYGAAGNDALYGGLGSDLVFGGAGDDTIGGSSGSDSLDGGKGVNLLNFWDSAPTGHGVTVNLGRLTKQVINDGYGTQDTAVHFQNIDGTDLRDLLTGNRGANVIWGEAGADRLFGAGGKDSLYGGDGSDSIYGGSGDDEVQGGKGRDVFYGGAGNDHFGFWDVDGSGHGVVVDLTQATQNILDDGYGNVETATGFETISGSAFDDSISGGALGELLWGNGGNDTLNGGGGNDTLKGGDNEDTLDGGDGDDVIWCSPGYDFLVGGLGADLFNFNDDAPASNLQDNILDMTPGVDKIGLPVWWTTGLTGQTTLTASQFLSQDYASQAQTADQFVIYDSYNGGLFFDVDGSAGTYAPVLIAILYGHPALTYQDFVLWT